MRYILFAALLLALAACTPQSPTGSVIATGTHWDDHTMELVSVEPLGGSIGDIQMRIVVRGDVVYNTVKIDGVEYALSGSERADGWIENQGVLITRLPPGKYELLAYSCFESILGWECGCRGSGDCGHWMKRPLVVPERYLIQDPGARR